MGRSYPRFIYSDPRNTKSAGPFIVHTLPPQMIVKVSFTEEGFHQLKPLSVFTPADDATVNEVIYRMHDWLTGQRMEEANLSADFYIRTSDISRAIAHPQFFDNVSCSVTYKPVMGSKLEVGKDDWNLEILFADDDTYSSTVRKLQEAYRRKFGLAPNWPFLIRS